MEQIQVEVHDDDTGGSLYPRIREAERVLFQRFWPRLIARAPIEKQPLLGKGSYHDKAAFAALLKADPRSLSEVDRGRLERALTFPGKPGLASTD